MPSLSAPAGKKENELKAHLDGNKLDLSLMQHDSITPALVRQIGALPKGKDDRSGSCLVYYCALDVRCNQSQKTLSKLSFPATEVDLSCNRLQTVSPQFCTLSQITHLDLSKNAITELPEEIGQMTGLIYCLWTDQLVNSVIFRRISLTVKFTLWYLYCVSSGYSTAPFGSEWQQNSVASSVFRWTGEFALVGFERQPIEPASGSSRRRLSRQEAMHERCQAGALWSSKFNSWVPYICISFIIQDLKSLYWWWFSLNDII